MLIIPAIDLRENKVVRLFQGDYNQTKVYGTNPVDYAKHFESLGAKRLHIVDLDGAKEGKPVHRELIKKIVKEVKIPVQVGGGIREEETIKDYIENGVSQVILGTKAVEDFSFLKKVSEKYKNHLMISVDIKGEKLALSGWLRLSELSYIDFIKELNQLPLFAIIVTVIERDGTGKGVDTEKLKKILEISKHSVILAGGVRDLKDLEKLKSFEDKGLLGVITGRAIYEGTLDLKKAFSIFQN